MKRKLLLFGILLLAITSLSGQKLFDRIKAGDSEYLKYELKKDLTYENLITIKDIINEDTAFSAIYSVFQWSAFSNCIPCMEELMLQREKLQGYFNIQHELNQSLAPAVSKNNIQMVDYLIG